MRKAIRPQLSGNDLEKVALETIEEGGKAVLYFLMGAVLLNFVTSASPTKFFPIFIRALQFIIHIPMLSAVVCTPNVMSVFAVMLKVGMYDFLESWVDVSFLGFSEPELEIPSQIEDLGFGSSNSILNLNTVAIVILFILARMALILILKLILLWA